ncbi:hypothetical protein N9I63_04935, partial [Hyphomicrobiales bacterium]|nr:hypothetical protein [Hyphomicrobiales bacterium]
MCIVCNAIGYNHSDLNGPGSSLAFNDPLSSWGTSSFNAKNEDSFNSQEQPSLFKDATSSSTTLNFNDGNNIIIPSEDGATYRGLNGDDAYIISSETTEVNSKIEIIDTSGKNTVQLIDGLTIKESLFTSDAARLTLSDGSTVTINGADKFTFELSGNLTSGTVGVNKTFSEFATYMGIDSLPASGSQSGSSNITIDELRTKTKTDLKTLLSGDTRTIQSTETLEVDLESYFTFPEVPEFEISTTDLSSLNDLSGLDSIVLYQDNEKATIAIRADQKGIKIFDTSFLNINPDYTYDYEIFMYLFWQYLGTDAITSDSWWQREEIASSNYLDNIYDRLEIEPNAIYLSPETYFDSDGESYYYKIIRVEERLPVEERQGGFIIREEKTWFDTENARKILLFWKDENDKWKNYTIKIDSVFDDNTDILTLQNKMDALKNPLNVTEYEIRDNSYPFFTRDQIEIDGSELIIKGGEENSEVLSTKVTIRAYFKPGNGYKFENENEKNYEDVILTIAITDDDFVKNKSSKIIESNNLSTSISIVEDNPGDILLDLKNFNIDPGSAKIKDIKINFNSKSEFEVYLKEIFYIDENVLKFSQGALYDYDGDQILFIHHQRNDANDTTVDAFEFTRVKENLTSSVRDNDFEITFTYQVDGKDLEHTLKIVDYNDTDSGSFLTQDHVLTYETPLTDNKYINGLNTSTRLTHSNSEVDSVSLKEDEWANYETFITYAFSDPLEGDFPLNSHSTFLDTCYFTPFGTIDVLWSPNTNAKNMVREILDRTSELFTITFQEVDANSYDDAQIRFNFYETTSEVGRASFAYLPSITRTDIFLLTDLEYNFVDPLNFNDSPQGNKTWTTRHEIGHSLGLSHPFNHFVRSKELDEELYPEYYYANSLFTSMAYAEFWSKDTDKYAENDPKYASTVYSVVEETNFSFSNLVKVTPSSLSPLLSYPMSQPNWARDDILTLGYKYGLRENYNDGDNTYSWSDAKNIYETIHDMGGNDTINLSNYNWNMKINLNPGAVSEVGINQERLNFDGPPGDDTVKNGDVFILSWSTVIENYVGSKGSDDVTLNTSIINTITTGDGDDVVRDALPTDIVNTGAGADTIYLSYTTLDPAIDVSIDGGSEADAFDLVIYDLQPDIEVDFTQSRITFVNFEGHNFTDNEKQTIILDNEDFITINSQTLT